MAERMPGVGRVTVSLRKSSSFSDIVGRSFCSVLKNWDRHLASTVSLSVARMALDGESHFSTACRAGSERFGLFRVRPGRDNRKFTFPALGSACQCIVAAAKEPIPPSWRMPCGRPERTRGKAIKVSFRQEFYGL